MAKRYIFSFFLFIFIQVSVYSQSITSVASFGTNPGALNMYTYVPSGISGKAALVVAMHGCTENANLYATQTGWNKLANLHKFYVIYPEQVSANNSSLCFNWFDTTDASRNVGEALSIKQMVDYMKAHYAIDTTEIFVTGLSAGAAMTTVMIATYPDVFSKAAIMSGLPYKAATSVTAAFNAQNGYVTMTPAQWGALVKTQYPTYKGPYAKVMITQGTSDLTVSPTNATELVKQWTYLNKANQTADSTNNAFQGNSNVVLTIYDDSITKVPAVYLYKITGMPHGIAVDTGSCPRQGGATGTYALEETNFHSTYWAADFFNLIPNPYSITGSISVSVSASGITYSVPNTTGSTYTWTVPAGATIISGQGKNSITVNFGTHSGNVSVTETEKGGCKNDPATLYVNVGVTGMDEVSQPEGRMYYNQTENSIHTENIPVYALQNLHIYNLLGQDCTPVYSIQGKTLILQKKLPNNMYIISVQDAVKQYSGKIVVF